MRAKTKPVLVVIYRGDFGTLCPEQPTIVCVLCPTSAAIGLCSFPHHGKDGRHRLSCQTAGPNVLISNAHAKGKSFHRTHLPLSKKKTIQYILTNIFYRIKQPFNSRKMPLPFDNSIYSQTKLTIKNYLKPKDQNTLITFLSK